MLYLEDYLEMIEHLPQELRDRFTEMRELDLSVQNSMDQLEKKTRVFYQQCKRGELKDEACDYEYQLLRREYYKTLEDADEKVNIAAQIHELVERYLRRLDSELFKFKCELEADNNGITEILEKRSLEMDGMSSAATALLDVINASQKENRYFSSPGSVGSSNSHGMMGSISSSSTSMGSQPSTPTAMTKDNRYRTPKPEKRRDSTNSLITITEKRPNLGNNLPPTPQSINIVRPITPNLGAHTILNTGPAAVAVPVTATAVAYNLQQLTGSASTAIAAAASQAIVATQQMQQGRRTASLKASYEAIHGGSANSTEFWISREISNAASAAAHTTLQGSSSSSDKKQKKKIQPSLSANSCNVTLTQPSTLTLSSSPTISVDAVDIQSSSSAVTGVGVSSLAISNMVNVANVAGVTINRLVPAAPTSTATALTPNSNITVNENGMVVEQTADGEWSYDPNEPRYCTCNQVSYGDMVACDNDACPYEWFHYPCVGITQPPKGKWYCPKCTASMRRRNRKN